LNIVYIASYYEGKQSKTEGLQRLEAGPFNKISLTRNIHTANSLKLCTEMMIPALLILLVSSSEKARPEWRLGGQEDVLRGKKFTEW